MSEAEATTEMVPETVAPLVGLVIEAVGGVVSAGTIETLYTALADEVKVGAMALVTVSVKVYWLAVAVIGGIRLIVTLVLVPGDKVTVVFVGDWVQPAGTVEVKLNASEPQAVESGFGTVTL